MSTAILYIRVSTDEQAQKGYSQRSQEEKLNQYCKDNRIEIVQIIFEDHSAKNFNRPAWSTMMKGLMMSKATRPDFILFTRWDRFSRNTANAYYMITQLQKISIEPQATDQPLDMLIPENKVLLAMYIVTAEVENDRRSLNVKQGMHKAKTEGRYMGKAPIGYINISRPDGTKTIVPREPEATLIRKAFENFDSRTSIRNSYKAIFKSGLKCSLNAFFNLLNNPVYCGKIRIKSLDKKNIHEIPGIHEPIISQELFNVVQTTIKRRDKKYVKQNTNSQLILRGILHCPLCLKKLSGSGSKGRSKTYFYYHCSSPCNYRVRTDQTNKHLLYGISALDANAAYIPIFEQLVKDAYDNIYNQKTIDKTKTSHSINKIIERIANAKELLIKGVIEEEDYLSIKSDCEKGIDILGEQLNDAYKLDVQRKQSFKKLTSFFVSPNLILQGADISARLKIASIFFKENLVYKEADIIDCLKTEARIIYGLQHSKLNGYLHKVESTNFKKRKEELTGWIIGIEKGKGSNISNETALQVLSFLRELAKLCVSEKMEGNLK